MKATKKIVGATAALVAAVALSAGSTFAWFATNNTVSVTGFEINTSTTTDNLLITDQWDTVSSLVNWANADTTVAYTGAPDTLQPCTLLSNITPAPSPTVETDSGLVAPTTNNGIDSASGVAGSGVTYEAAVKDDNFIELGYYLANSTSGEKTLNVSLTNIVYIGGQASNNDSRNAVRVDFYVMDAPEDNSVAITTTEEPTLSLDFNDYTYNAGSAADISGTLGSVNIPTTTDTVNGLMIVIRIYYDGAVGEDGSYTTSDANPCIVRSSAVVTSNLQFDIEFSIPSSQG